MERGQRFPISVVSILALVSILTGCTGAIPVVRHRELTAPALQKTVRIYRDAAGIPHIFGDSEEDILFGVGYAMAEDRLFQLEMVRRFGMGELAAVLGRDLVPVDEKARTNGYTAAELNLMIEQMDPDIRRLFKSMVAGINHYMDETQADPDNRLPLEFKALKIPLRHYAEGEILAGVSVITRKYSTAGGGELLNQAFFDDLVKWYGINSAKIIFDDVLTLTDPDAYATSADSSDSKQAISLRPFKTTRPSPGDIHTVLARYEESREKYDLALSGFGLAAGASRSMTIGPARSASGNVLMMQATADGHEVHIHGAGLDAAGLSIAPCGLPVMGRTADFGWLITTGERDTIDTFVEKLNPENKHQYWFKGQWRDMDVRSETIEVKGGKPVVIKVARTVHGPVIEWDLKNNRAYSQQWASWLSEGNAWSSFVRFVRAKSLAEMEDIVINKNIAVNNNLSYGDRQGNIAFWHTGNLPIRAAEADPRLPTPGTGEYEWQGFVEPAQRPHLKNPKKGWLFAWNSKPSSDTVFADGSRWGKHFRTYLPVSLIEGDNSVTLDDMKQFNKTIAAAFGSVDLTITATRFFEPFWQEAVQGATDQRIKDAVALMTAWNNMYEDLDGDGYYDHVGLTLFRKWLPVAERVVFEDDLGEWWHRLDDKVYIKYRTSLFLRVLEGDKAGKPVKWDFFNGKSRRDVILETLQQTLTELEKTYGTADMARWKHPVFWRYLAQGGSDNPSRSKLPPDGPSYLKESAVAGGGIKLGYLPKAVRHNGLPNWTAIMEIGNTPPRLLSAIPSGGQSWFINTGWKASPHINDQYWRHRDFDYKVIEMDADTIMKNCESETVLRPAP